MTSEIRVTVWNEFRHEREDEEVKRIYPDGIHAALAAPLRDAGFLVHTATLDEPYHGLTDEVLEDTDVLIWWGHIAHDEVSDDIVEKVVQRVWAGMGLVVLHSGHFSKVFKRLMGTSCNLKWRQIGEHELLWVVNPSHPVAAGVGEFIDLPREEMYGEHFDVPAPDELVFIGSFEGGEVFRSGSVFYRGNGKVFYFQPGHETYPTYYQEQIKTVIRNAVKWAAASNLKKPLYGNYPLRHRTVRKEEKNDG
ncbi:ThuA domain-containing protein [Alicyclobacillus sp. SO9]|uniref:ThuA domain-containing protein n=1 Tax=Alicyclobacillus sp. SO9 TaxID=2665646 RepID=UPI0018E75081|nr:ThuA domain-containing protein [Alicyclobacillus sp. SO9]QQE77555.1 ThuA domain-containing protein [Alicyclobacillus sp. SO9]